MRLALALVLLSFGCGSTLPRHVDLLVSRYHMYGFTGSVLVAQHGRVVLDRTYGVAERAFDVGSIMKTVVAASVLELQAEDKLHVTDPISRHVGSLPVDRGSITIEQLLLHTSGLPLDVRNGDLLATVAT